jgi:uncharacterized sulfatase
MNIVLLMTDTQTTGMVGAYGGSDVETPSLDRLADRGVRFQNSFVCAPTCTPSRSAIFTGQYPPINGAWANNLAPSRSVPMMGTVLRRFGVRAGYTGKWHLDGTTYFGDGVADGGFEPDWWFDGSRFLESIGPGKSRSYMNCHTIADLTQLDLPEEKLWAHQVADRAIDFLETVGDEQFVLVASFDEPHEPSVAPRDYWERFEKRGVGNPPGNPSRDKIPELHRIHSERLSGSGRLIAENYERHYAHLLAANSYVDSQIGRVLDAVDTRHGDDTIVIYTTDHGDMWGQHGLYSKGPMMYQPVINVPLIVAGPGIDAAGTSDAVVSHIDIFPTILDLLGIDPPPSLHGISMAGHLRDRNAGTREHAFCSHTRFAINHDQYGEFYPVRAVTDGRYKLIINLIDTDEFYDLLEDPVEERNLVTDPGCTEVRNRLHDVLLDEMDRVRDPFRSFAWGSRSWRSVREMFYWGGENRERPAGFSFEPESR